MKFCICSSCCSLWLQIFSGCVRFLGWSYATHLWVIEWRQKYSALAKIKACSLSGKEKYLKFSPVSSQFSWVWNQMSNIIVFGLTKQNVFAYGLISKTNMSHRQQCFLTLLFQYLGTACQLLCPMWWSPLCLCTAFVVAVWTAPLLGWLMLTWGGFTLLCGQETWLWGQSHAVILFTSNPTDTLWKAFKCCKTETRLWLDPK